MAIAAVKQKGGDIYVYNEKGILLFNKHGELAGYTSSTVSVKKGNQVSTYDEKGYLKFSK